MSEALVIGNNYLGSSCELSGCFNDADEAARRLSALGYTVTMLREATRKQIIKGLTKLVAKPGRKYLHYSGHGSQRRQSTLAAGAGQSTVEADGLDECLCGVDADVTDDEVFLILKRLSPTSQLVAVLDCCHSGSAFDLRYNYVGNSLVSIDTEELAARVVMFSGCRDAQTSADVAANTSVGASQSGTSQSTTLAHGAMTRAFFDTLLALPDATIKQQLSAMRKQLKAGGFSQVPQVSFGRFEAIKTAKLGL